MNKIMGSITCNSENLVLASACQDKLACWREELRFFNNLHLINCFNHLLQEMIHLKPDILLLDYGMPGLNGVLGVSNLRKLCPATKIIIMSGPSSEEEEWTLFRAGVRGCCSDSFKPQSLITLFNAIQKGELWIRRAHVHRLLEQLLDSSNNGNRVNVNGLSLLENLTQREYEIAVRVGNGENNKQIAHSLNISDRTVKAHLAEVFRKLGVSDRLKVAVILSGEKRRARRQPQKNNNNQDNKLTDI